MEKIGYQKRDLLVNRVKSARNEQEEAKEEFASALEHFAAVLEFEGGELEKVYNRLNRALERSEARANAVHERISDVKEVAEALFKEWEEELEAYSSADLRNSSSRQLEQTRDRYSGLIMAMKKAESKLEPVLVPMRDQVLFLKHNLNARAISSIQNEVPSIEMEVSALIEEMERAIAEADAFIQEISTI
jgi:SMC interacting uncharacterized protein involved in chromosome segregation